jgi:outer membrane protein assembly factor BamB
MTLSRNNNRLLPKKGSNVIRYKKMLIGKILFLLIFLITGATFSGCVGLGGVPLGWSGIAITDNSLFFGSMQGELVALNSNGNLLWETPLENSGSSSGFSCTPGSTSVAIYGMPAVSGDLVYAGGYNGRLYLINADTRLSKDVYLDRDNPQPIVGGPVVAQGQVYIASSDGKLYALDDVSLNKKWEFPTGDKIWSTPAIYNDTLFIGSFDKKLYAINTNGSMKWEFSTQGAIVSTPLVYNNTVYVGSFDRYFYAIDATNGQMKWKSQEVAEKWFWASPVAYNNTIYAPSLNGMVYIFDAGSGQQIDIIDLNSPISSSPIVIDGKVIVATEEGKIYSINTTDNLPRQLANLEEKIYAPISASNGVIYIHTQKGILYEVDGQTGANRQLYQIT